MAKKINVNIKGQKSGRDKIANKNQQAELKKQEFKAAEQKRLQEAAEAEKLAMEQKELQEKNAIIAEIEAKNADARKTLKSKAKAVGLKSTFVVGDNKILMTSFGRGNEAVLDKYIEGEKVSDASEQAVLKVNLKGEEKEFPVSGRIVTDASTDNPLYHPETKRAVGLDQLQAKDKLEKMYFGKTFTDNIHIQLIYKVMDIEKILAVHVNNIVYELNNILRDEADEHADLIGYLGDRKSFENFKKTEVYPLFSALLKKKQLGYFGKTFLGADAKGKDLTGAALDKWEERCYYLMTILGVARQATAHGDEDNRSKIFRIDTYNKLDEASALLDELYAEKIRELNENFIAHSGRDLTIAMKILDANTDEEKKKVINDFYSFVILKSYKNLGFSIKRVRENLAKVYPTLQSEDYNTVRRKLNRHLDFIIWTYYSNNKSQLDILVDNLRASSTELDKELIYRGEAKRLWSVIGSDIEHKLLPKMDGDVIGATGEFDATGMLSSDICISSKADSFTKMVYFLTIFLDGKEINDLLTQLISCFENINGFLDVMKAENIDCAFVKKYEMLADSLKISNELRVVNSFARMSEDAVTKKIMFKEAAILLGYDQASSDQLDEYIDSIVSKEKMKTVGGKRDTNFRNFIINNVIESSRFKYLVRYGDPAKIRKLADNENVVRFVLKEIPNEQIQFYYNSCNGVKIGYKEEMREDLVKKIKGLTFKDFEKVNSKNAADKELKKNIVRLYLTVLYLLVKNLVYVNSRYFLAFHCAERDRMICMGENNKSYIPSDTFVNSDSSWYTFAKEFVEANSNNKRAKGYIAKNISYADAWSCRTYRNCTEHLNAIRNADLYINDIGRFDSYFELYHYLMQRTLMDQFEYECNHKSKHGGMIMSVEKANPKMLEYFELVSKYNTYCKDFVKTLNTPFAYNLARYKNLSIKELFDRNDYNSKTKENIKAGEED